MLLMWPCCVTPPGYREDMLSVQTFRFPAKCSPGAHRRLTVAFGMCAELYNAALESWKGTYAWWREHHPGEAEKFPPERRRSKYDLMGEFTGVRSDLPEWERLAVQVGRGVLCRFDRTTSAFYKRCKGGSKPGFPRFKASRRWRTIEIPDATSSMVVPPGANGGSAAWWRLAVKGLPSLRFRDKGHRLGEALEGGARVRELRVVRTPLRTEVHVVVRHPEREAPQMESVNPVGIDVGLTHRLTLSDGRVVAPRKVDASRTKRAQRRLSRAKKGSRSREKKGLALAKAHRREKERAVQADFRLAHRLVTSCDGIAVEDLNVAGMLKSKRFSKKMSEQRWSSLNRILGYKAEKAGIPFERVDPRHTTTDCASCGHRQPMPLSLRVFHCGSCGMCADRDVNAAVNIRARAFGLGSGGTIPDAMRATNFDCKTGTPPGECSAGRHRRTVSPKPPVATGI